MLKKALAILALFTTLSSAAWDYLPILPKGLGQTAFQFEYTSMDPLSSIDLRAGIRYSPLNWFEVSAILPYRIATSYDGDEPEIEAMVDEMDGIGNITFGVRFQFTETFSAYVDGYLPGEKTYTEDTFFLGVGLQHSSIFSHMIWSTDLSFIYGDEWTNMFINFGNELNILFGAVVPYLHVDFIYGLENDSSANGYYSDEDEGGNNGLVIGPGVKFSLIPNLTLEAVVLFYMGDRFTSEDMDDPMTIGLGIYYTF